MRTALCDSLGITYPIVGFTPSEHVAAAISRAGGLGVLGCVRFNDADELDRVLDWMDANTEGKPYGVDIVMPSKVPDEGSMEDLHSYIPDEHRAFVERTLADLGVPELRETTDDAGVLGWLHSVARAHVDTALKHPISLIANALGSPPADIIGEAHACGVQVAALAGKAEHASNHVDNGVDIVVAQGYEAGGHTGEIASMVLLPEVAEQVGHRVPVLAAGGIGSGKQVAAALALGASGAWMGSYWLTTSEYLETMTESGTMQQAMVEASSADTVRTRIFSGKPARLLKTRWTQAWENPEAPEPLPMPLQNILVSQAHERIAAAEDPSVVAMPVGQVVGRMNEVRSVADVMSDLVGEFHETVSHLDKAR